MTLRATLAALSLSLPCLLLSGCIGKPKPLSSADPQHITEFKPLFNQSCAGCHGLDGKQGAAPRLNDALYLSLADDDTLFGIIQSGRPGTPMPGVGRHAGGDLDDGQIRSLIAGMRKEWAKTPDLGGVPVPIYAVEKAPPGDAKRGQPLYMKNCMACHGYAKFKGVAGPIADPNYLALASDQGLRTTMIVGRLDWGMPDWRHRTPRHPMTDQEIADVVAWLATLRPGYASQGEPAAVQTAAAANPAGAATSGQEK